MTAEKRQLLKSESQWQRANLQAEHDAAVRELKRRRVFRQAWESLTMTTTEVAGFGFGTGYTKTRSRGRPTATVRQLEDDEELWIFARIAKASQLALRTDDRVERADLRRAIALEQASLEGLKRRSRSVTLGVESAKERVKQSRSFNELIAQAHSEARKELPDRKPGWRAVLRALGKMEGVTVRPNNPRQAAEYDGYTRARHTIQNQITSLNQAL